MNGRVYLVGAGCGSADLITLRGLECLKRCDTVVYDDLIDPALLNFVPDHAQRIYMGKRSGKHSAPQSEISAKLVELASHGKVVVRLKGGDPFVFGRGGEELLALKQAGIPFDMVPGISSSIAIPAWAGIPVTHRGLSRSFHVITGHTADTDDSLPADLPYLAKCGGTLIFLMGLSRLSTIANKLVEYGRTPETPAAVISGGNSPNPAAVRGTLATIAEKAAGVLPPAVIVVGDVAALDLSPTIPLPLSGARIALTGTPSLTDRLGEQLRTLGGTVTVVQQMEVHPLPPAPELRELCSPKAKWVVLTSPNGVEVLFRQLSALSIDLRKLHACRFAVIGPATGKALSRHGIFPDLCPDEHNSEALAKALVSAADPDEEIFLPRSAQGAPILANYPRDTGFQVHEIPIYDTVPSRPSTPCETAADYLVFASGAGVDAYFNGGGQLHEHTVPVCIGPVTAHRLAVHTKKEPLISAETDAEELVTAILTHYRG